MNMPAEQMQPMDEGPQMLSDDDEKDIDIAAAAAIDIMGQPEMQEMLSEIMQSDNPIPLFAANMAELIEEVMESSKGVELDLNPHIWFAEGGVLDDIADELSDIVGADVAAMMPELKPAIMEAIKKKAEQFKQQGIGQPEEQEMEPEMQPQPRRMPPVLGSPQ